MYMGFFCIPNSWWASPMDESIASQCLLWLIYQAIIILLCQLSVQRAEPCSYGCLGWSAVHVLNNYGCILLPKDNQFSLSLKCGTNKLDHLTFVTWPLCLSAYPWSTHSSLTTSKYVGWPMDGLLLQVALNHHIYISYQLVEVHGCGYGSGLAYCHK